MLVRYLLQEVIIDSGFSFWFAGLYWCSSGDTTPLLLAARCHHLFGPCCWADRVWYNARCGHHHSGWCDLRSQGMPWLCETVLSMSFGQLSPSHIFLARITYDYTLWAFFLVVVK